MQRLPYPTSRCLSGPNLALFGCLFRGWLKFLIGSLSWPLRLALWTPQQEPMKPMSVYTWKSIVAVWEDQTMKSRKPARTWRKTSPRISAAFAISNLQDLPKYDLTLQKQNQKWLPSRKPLGVSNDEPSNLDAHTLRRQFVNIYHPKSQVLMGRGLAQTT